MRVGEDRFRAVFTVMRLADTRFGRIMADSAFFFAKAVMGSAGEIILAAGIAAAVGVLLVREVLCFVRWRRDLGRLDRGERSRSIRER